MPRPMLAALSQQAASSSVDVQREKVNVIGVI
jgi:hypothetical protein